MLKYVSLRSQAQNTADLVLVTNVGSINTDNKYYY